MTYPTMPVLFYQSRFRQYRVRLKDNIFVKIQRKITTPQQLKVVLDKLMPEDCYQTISWWLSPQFLGKKKMVAPKYPQPKHLLYLNGIYRYKKIRNNLFLGSDYAMDFDLKDYKGGLEQMSAHLKLARIFLQEQGMVEHIIMRTPSGGRQLLVTDFDRWANVHRDLPSDRESDYLLRMKTLTTLLIKAGVKWDDKVSIDTRRVIRTPNTVRASTGKKATLLEFKPEYIIR